MIFVIFFILSTLIGLVYILNKINLNKTRKYWEQNGIKYFQTNGLSLWTTKLFKLDLLKGQMADYNTIEGSYGGCRQFFQPSLIVKDPEVIKKILIKDFDHFVNRRDMKFDPIFDKALSMLKDKEWKETRTIMSPTFTTGKIRRMFDNFQTVSNQFIDYLSKESDITDEIDMRDCFNRVTADSIASAAFGFQTDSLQNRDAQFTKMAKRFSNPAKGQMFKAFIFLTMPKISKLLGIQIVDREAMDFYTDVVKGAIKTREDSKQKRDDFLSLMLESKWGILKDEDQNEKEGFEVINSNGTTTDSSTTAAAVGEKIDDEMILAQSLIFLIAGFSTVELLLSFAAYEMVLNPDIQQKLAEEAQRALSESENQKFDFDSILKMDYLDRFISEILRKYPPAIGLERRCNKDYQIPDTKSTIPKGSLVMIPTYAIHMDEKYFPQPEKFQPDRFLPEEKAKRSPYTYLPFGHGPRNCIGMRFALVEAKVILANLVLNFEIVPCKKTQIPMVLTGQMGSPQPEKGVFVKLLRRN